MMAVMAVVIVKDGRRGAPGLIVMLDDDLAAGRIAGVIGGCDFCGPWRRLLHGVDHAVADAHVAETDEVADGQRLRGAVGADVRGDHVVGEAGLRHGNDILRRDCALHLTAHPGFDLGPRAGQIGVDCFAHGGTGDRANRRADERSGTGVAGCITDGSADARAGQAAEEAPRSA